LGINQLKKLKNFVQKRCEIAKKYNSLFPKSDILKVPCSYNSVEHAYHLYPLQIDFEKTTISKLSLFEKMKQKGFGLQVHYIPVHTQPFYKKNYNFKLGDYPLAENFYYRAVSVPLYPSLSDEEVEKLAENMVALIKEN